MVLRYGKVSALILAGAMVASSAACAAGGTSDYQRHRGKGDAPILTADWNPREVYETPNGYGEFCDSHHNLVIMGSQVHDSAAPFLVVLKDDVQACPNLPKPSWINPNP